MKTTTAVAARVPKATAELAKLAAEREGITLSSWAGRALHEAAVRELSDSRRDRSEESR